jgi:dTDP-glucose 4,6-dehydratase
MRKLKNIMVTGGCGFIGSNFIRYLFKNTNFDGTIINIDKITYAGNPLNLARIDEEYGQRRYFFLQIDICDFPAIRTVLKQYDVDTVVHFAAESHVDRSIYGPKEFIQTNIVGTFTLLDAVREYWTERDDVLFHHISTDEVYGSLGETGYFFEDTPYDPRSPYSASKASSDFLVNAYHNTYKIPVTISNCSNNYGPFQFPEKLIPLAILNVMEEKPVPVYGDGKNIRDWLYVDDHNSAIWAILNKGRTGETYNIGGENEWENIHLVEVLCEKIAQLKNRDSGYYKKLITYVKDRPGHDRRYAINCDKLKNELGWRKRYDFGEGLDNTIQWYGNNNDWIRSVRSGEYRKWIQMNYAGKV